MNPWQVSNSLILAARLAAYDGDLADAENLCHRALEIRRQVGNQGTVSEVLELLGVLANRADSHLEAARLFGAAEALRDALQVPLELTDQVNYERSVNAVRAELGDAPFAVAWADGKALPLEVAIEEALTQLALA